MSSRPTSPAFAPPDAIEEYRILRRIGEGGMGQVFQAHDTLIERSVALKFLTSERTTEELRTQLLREARAAARVVHPNVVQIYRVGEYEGRPFLVTEFLRGQSLRSLKKPVDPEFLLRIAVEVGRGLAAAHRQGILHRDIKPANVVQTDEGHLKLVDFGLAKEEDPRIKDKEGPDPRDEQSGRGPRSEPAEGAPRSDGPLNDRSLAETLSAERRSRAQSVDRDRSTEHSGLSGPGTPLYMAPEIWRGEPASVLSDLYSFGALLYELGTGQAPYSGETWDALSQAVQTGALIPCREREAGIPLELSQLIDACLARNPSNRPRSVEDVLQALSRLGSPRIELPAQVENPYRGLHPFEAQHRALFFGRQQDRDMLLELLQIEPIVTVTGDSGVGKSSLCRAAILPVAQERGLEPSRRYRTVAVTPGRRPLLALAHALAPLLQQDTEALFTLLSREPAAAARALIRNQSGSEGLLLFFDQIEELVTESDAVEAVGFAELLGQLSTRVPGLRVLLTLRGDYLMRLLEVTDLATELTRALYVVKPMHSRELREVILGPARVFGVRFEPESMVDEMIQETSGSGGGLPLLQFALAELWRARDVAARVIQRSLLIELGGVRGALDRHADQVVLNLPPGQRRAARWLLTHMVHADRSRAVLTHSELLSGPALERTIRQAALEALIRGRLVVAQESIHAGVSYELAHEALVSGWRTLSGWLDADQERRTAENRLLGATAEWQRLGQPSELLWGSHQLEEFTAADVELGELPDHALLFLKSAQQQTRQRRWRRRLSWAGIALLIIASAFSLVQWDSRRQAERFIETLKLLLDLPPMDRPLSPEIRRRVLALVKGASAGNLKAYSIVRRAATLAASAPRLEAMQTIGPGLGVVSFSPDGQSLLTYRQKELVLWRIGQTSLVRKELTAPITAAMFSPSGRKLLALGTDERVWLLDYDGMGLSEPRSVPGLSVRNARFLCTDDRMIASDAQGGVYLLSGGSPQKILQSDSAVLRILSSSGCRAIFVVTEQGRLFNVPQDGTSPALEIEIPRAPVTDAVISADGSQIVLARGKEVVLLALQQTATGIKADVRKTTEDHDSSVQRLVLSPNGTRLISLGRELVVPIWSVKSGSLMQRLRGQSSVATDAAFSADGSRVALALQDGQILVQDVNTGGRLATLHHDGSAITSCAFSANGRYLAAADEAGTLRLWDAWVGATALLGGHGQTVWSATFSADSRTVLTSSGDGTARIWDWREGRTVSVLRHADPEKSNPVVPVAVRSPDGRQVLTVGFDGRAVLWDAATGYHPVELAAVGKKANDAAWSPTTDRAAAAFFDGTARIFDTKSRRLLHTLQHPGSPKVRALTFSPDGRWLVTGADDGKVRMWDVATGALLRELYSHAPDTWIIRVHVSPDGAYVVSAGQDKTARFLHLGSNRSCTIDGFSGWVFDAAASRDSRYAAAVSDDSRGQLFDLQQCRRIATLREHAASVRTVQFSPKEDTLLTAGADGLALLWHVPTGALLGKYPAHAAAAIGAAISPDGEWFVITSTDRTARVYPATLPGLVERLSENLKFEGRSED